MQGFAAFKANVQRAGDKQAALEKAAACFRNQSMASAFNAWLQHHAMQGQKQVCATSSASSTSAQPLLPGLLGVLTGTVAAKRCGVAMVHQCLCLALRPAGPEMLTCSDPHERKLLRTCDASCWQVDAMCEWPVHSAGAEACWHVYKCSPLPKGPLCCLGTHTGHTPKPMIQLYMMQCWMQLHQLSGHVARPL